MCRDISTFCCMLSSPQAFWSSSGPHLGGDGRGGRNSHLSDGCGRERHRIVGRKQICIMFRVLVIVNTTAFLDTEIHVSELGKAECRNF